MAKAASLFFNGSDKAISASDLSLPRFLTQKWGRGAAAPWPQFFVLAGFFWLIIALPGLSQSQINLSASFEQARQAALSGRLAESQALLERLVTVAPDTAAYRLALAEVLVRQGEVDRAQFHYQQLNGAVLGPKDRAYVAQRLASLKLDDAWQFRLSFGLVPQTNVGKRTSSETIQIGGLNFVLDNASRETSGIGLSYAAGASRAVPIHRGTLLRFGVQAQGYAYEESDFNDMRLRFHLGMEYLLAETVLIEGGFAHNLRFVADERYSTGPGFWLGGQVKLSPQTLMTVRGQTDFLRHPTAPGLDGHRHAVLVGLRHQAAPSLLATAQFVLDRTDARQSTQSTKGAALLLGARKFWTGGLILGLDLSQRYETHDGFDPLFGVRRKDRTTSATLRAAHRSFTIAGYAPTLEITHEKRQSTLSLARYRNTSVGVFLTRDF